MKIEKITNRISIRNNLNNDNIMNFLYFKSYQAGIEEKKDKIFLYSYERRIATYNKKKKTITLYYGWDFSKSSVSHTRAFIKEYLNKETEIWSKTDIVEADNIIFRDKGRHLKHKREYIYKRNRKIQKQKEKHTENIIKELYKRCLSNKFNEDFMHLLDEMANNSSKTILKKLQKKYNKLVYLLDLREMCYWSSYSNPENKYLNVFKLFPLGTSYERNYNAVKLYINKAFKED